MKQFSMLWVFTASLMLGLTGCSEETKQDMGKLKDDATKDAKAAGEKAEEMAGKAGEKIKEGASSLSEQAMAFLKPIKEKIGGLDNLKDKPAELKKSVENLIETIESKAESMNLPEKARHALTKVKEKLIALRDYLGGDNPKPAEVEKHIHEVKDVGSDLE